MTIKLIQWIIGLVLVFYFWKALLGQFREGDFFKAGILAAIWIGIALFTSGLIGIG